MDIDKDLPVHLKRHRSPLQDLMSFSLSICLSSITEKDFFFSHPLIVRVATESVAAFDVLQEQHFPALLQGTR